MTARTELVPVADVRRRRSWLFTATDPNGGTEEVVVVPCEGGAAAWVNRCTHEAQRLDTGFGATTRDGEIVCPKHGSMFDACSGDCDNGPAAETTLVPVEVETEDGVVYLVDDGYEFRHEGGTDGGSDGPGSTSHISF